MEHSKFIDRKYLNKQTSFQEHIVEHFHTDGLSRF